MKNYGVVNQLLKNYVMVILTFNCTNFANEELRIWFKRYRREKVLLLFIIFIASPSLPYCFLLTIL
jgi:uncharacterized membrane protein YoaK (UPF0700 family)